MMKTNIDDLTSDELLKVIRKRKLKTGENLKPAIKAVSTQTVEDHLLSAGIKPTCPKCGSVEHKQNGLTAKGTHRFKYKCGKTFTLLTDTIFDSLSYSWDEWVGFVESAINFNAIQNASSNYEDCQSKVHPKNADMWLVRMRIYQAMTLMPIPQLSGNIQMDEKYFREAQKGSDRVIDFFNPQKTRFSRMGGRPAIANYPKKIFQKTRTL